jgi:hypothetical protein
MLVFHLPAADRATFERGEPFLIRVNFASATVRLDKGVVIYEHDGKAELCLLRRVRRGADGGLDCYICGDGFEPGQEPED